MLHECGRVRSKDGRRRTISAKFMGFLILYIYLQLLFPISFHFMSFIIIHTLRNNEIWGRYQKTKFSFFVVSHESCSRYRSLMMMLMKNQSESFFFLLCSCFFFLLCSRNTNLIPSKFFFFLFFFSSFLLTLYFLRNPPLATSRNHLKVSFLAGSFYVKFVYKNCFPFDIFLFSKLALLIFI